MSDYDAGKECEQRENLGMRRGTIRHAKSVENPDWPHESYCTGCGHEWPCSGVEKHS
jgi:hypothetical protein